MDIKCFQCVIGYREISGRELDGKLTQTEHAEVKRVCGSHDVVSIMKVGSEKPCVVEGVENRSFKLTDSTDMPHRLRVTPNRLLLAITIQILV